MKALLRYKGETITEDMDIPCIDWNTGYPLTDPKWFGGAYLLVHNYDPDDEPSPVMVPQSEPVQEPEPEPEIEDEDDYVVIDGKRYSKEELRRLIE